jgi:antitoxin MazE
MGQIMIQKWGNSQGIRLPKHILESCELEVGDTLQIEVKGKKLMLSAEDKHKRRGQYKLEELLAQIPTGFKNQETDWGTPMGKEI